MTGLHRSAVARAVCGTFVVSVLLLPAAAAPVADAAASRDQASEKLRQLILRGDANAKSLGEWFKQASNGRKPPKKATQEALAAAIADAVSDRKLILSEAARLADGLAAAANADDLSKEDVATKKEGTLEVLEQARASEKQREAVATAYDQAVKEQK